RCGWRSTCVCRCGWKKAISQRAARYAFRPEVIGKDSGTHMSEQALPAGADETRTWLERHAQRRARRVPTLSVLSGPVGLGVRAWREWAASEQRPVVQLSCTDPETMAGRWTAAVARQRDLTANALALLAARAGRTPDDLRASWAGKTLHDLE